MIEVNYSGYDTYSTDPLTQWDVNQSLKISGLSIKSAPTILFSNRVSVTAEPVAATLGENNIISCDIPNGLLTENYPIVAYVRSETNGTLATIAKIKIPVIPAKKPDDYFFIENITIITYESILSRIESKAEKSDVNTLRRAIEEIESDGVTTETIEKKCEEVINEAIESGSLAAMTIPDGSITKEKLSPDIELEPGANSITTEKIADKAVTFEKLKLINEGQRIDYARYYSSTSMEISADILRKILSEGFTLLLKADMSDDMYTYVSGYLRIRSYPDMYSNLSLNRDSDYFTVTSETSSIEVNGQYYKIQKYSLTQKNSSVIDDICQLNRMCDLGNFLRCQSLIVLPYSAVVNEELIINDFKTSDTIDTNFKNLIFDIVGEEPEEETPIVDFSSLSGKYGLHIGDSYTKAMAAEDLGYSVGAFTALNEKIKMAGTLNYGIVSSTIRDGSNSSGFSYNPIVSRVCQEGNSEFYVPLDRDDIGYITLMGGTNDSAGIESSIGSDIYDGASYHIYGAMHRIMETLLNAYPGIPLIIILQPCSANNENTENPESIDISKLSKSLKSVLISQRKQKAIKEVAELYARTYKNVYIVDCCFNWYSPLNSDDLEKIWSSDLLHLTTNGYKEITEGTKYDSVYKKLVEIYSIK